MSKSKTAAFTASRLTPTVFKIVEYDDIYSEHPFIYAKICADPKVIMIVDTGCGGASNDAKVDVKSLREFIETWPVEDNGGKPLNEGGKWKYVVVCTHCHYDHILGLEQFAGDSPILASGHSPSFLSPENIANNSLCTLLGIKTPRYTPILVEDQDFVAFPAPGGHSLGVRLMYTPGHTPDEIALWDESENMLYVGDTVYEREPIIFPLAGDITEWLRTMDFLIDYVQRNGRPGTKINAGHVTSMGDALDVLKQGKSFIMDVLSGKEPLKRRSERDGIKSVEFAQASGRFSLRCPEVLLDAARPKA